MVPPVVIRSLRYFEVLNLNLAVSFNMGSIFSLSRRSAVLVPSCSATQTASPCYPAQAVYSSEFSDGKSVYTGEPLSYQFNHGRLVKVMIFLWTYQTRYISDNSWRFVDSVGNIDW